MKSQNIQSLSNVELKITSNFGKFEISESGEPKRVLSLSGNIDSISRKLKHLRKVFGYRISLNETRTPSSYWKLKTFSKIYKCDVWRERIFWPCDRLDQRLSAHQFRNTYQKKTAWTFASARWISTWRNSESESYNYYQNFQDGLILIRHCVGGCFFRWRWQWYCWHLYVVDSMLVTIFRCWWQKNMLMTFFCMLVTSQSVTKICLNVM